MSQRRNDQAALLELGDILSEAVLDEEGTGVDHVDGVNGVVVGVVARIG